MTDRICVAQIGAAHGLRGEVRLRSFTEQPEDFARYGALESEDGKQTFGIETMRAAKDGMIVRFRGVADRDAAEKLRHIKLYVARASLPALADAEEYYRGDLIGLAVVGLDGAPLGQVVALHNFGAGDLLEIKPMAGGATAMLPFTDAFVPSIEIEAGRIVVDPPADLFARAEAKPKNKSTSKD